MITGVGIDIVRVNRMERWLVNSKLLQRFFHHDELEIVFSRGKTAAQSLAAKFAAKEAFGKALGTGLANIELKDIMILSSGGKPEIKVCGTAQRALEKSGANRMHISLTHERENAVAMVVLEEV